MARAMIFRRQLLDSAVLQLHIVYWAVSVVRIRSAQVQVPLLSLLLLPIHEAQYDSTEDGANNQKNQND